MKNKKNYYPPKWAFDFHGHLCPLMPLGYRMGIIALEKMGLEREKDHTLHVICSLGEAHPQTCMMDGIQVATGATYGKLLMEKTFYGKLAATFWYPQKTPLRLSLKPSFLDQFGTQEFFSHRKKGLEPSQIAVEVTMKAVDWSYSLENEEIFDIKEIKDFAYQPKKGSFNKGKCSICGEYVFERYLRIKEGKPVCIPCSKY